MMDLYYDKKVAYDIAHNPVQNDCAKYVEVGKHFVKREVGSSRCLVSVCEAWRLTSKVSMRYIYALD